MPTRKLTKKRSHKVGLPPGSLVHVGERKTEKAKITLIRYDEVEFEERVVETPRECFPLKQAEKEVVWINVDGVHDIEILGAFGEACRLHPLTVEDILHTDQRPKLEEYDNYIFVVLKMLDLGRGKELFEAEQLSLILGPGYVLTFQEQEGDAFEPIRERIRSNKGRIRKLGSDYLAYSLIDAAVDRYFILLEDLEEKVEKVEVELLEGADAGFLPTIQLMRRELIHLRRSVWPLRELIGELQRCESTLIKESTQVYLRDVYDHTIHVIDTMESLRDLMAGILEVYLSSVSNRMNSVMKVLTVIATIFIPLTFVVGIYGMNFEYMPELKWSWGYPAVLAGMAGIVGLMLFYFKKKQWV